MRSKKDDHENVPRETGAAFAAWEATGGVPRPTAMRRRKAPPSISTSGFFGSSFFACTSPNKYPRDERNNRKMHLGCGVLDVLFLAAPRARDLTKEGKNVALGEHAAVASRRDDRCVLNSSDGQQAKDGGKERSGVRGVAVRFWCGSRDRRGCGLRCWRLSFWCGRCRGRSGGRRWGSGSSGDGRDDDVRDVVAFLGEHRDDRADFNARCAVLDLQHHRGQLKIR